MRLNKYQNVDTIIISATGHRPNKIFKSDYYSDDNFNKLHYFAGEILWSLKPDLVITGGALGWDQAVAWACRTLAINYEVHLPFEGFDSIWPAKSRNRLKTLMDDSNKVKIVCDKYYTGAYQARNMSMIDETTDKVLALWDGSSGGTANCIRYAKSEDKKIMNVWDAWLNYRDNG